MESVDRKKRFDETFKTLLIIVTITLSVTLSLYKDILGVTFFIDAFLNFIVSVFVWAIANIADGQNEYVIKLIGWHLLIYVLAVSFARILLGLSLIPQIPRFPIIMMRFMVFALILLSTYLIKGWLQQADAIPSETIFSRSVLWILGMWMVHEILFVSVIA